jgi:beta-barrel assembly-enhancing protease
VSGKAKGLLWLGIAIAAAAVVAVALPVAARHVPWTVEQWMGKLIGGVPRLNACTRRNRPESVAPFRKLVQKLYPLVAGDNELPITIEVLPGKTVNAYATLGGRIYIFDGLLKHAQSAEELAGVLAHELEHVRNRHIIQGVAVNLFTSGALSIVVPGDHMDSYLAFMLLTLKFTRQQEHEADVAGLERLRMARVDAAGFQNFFARAKNSPSGMQIISSHPGNEERAALAAQARGYPVEPIMDPAEWAELQKICD